MRVEGTRAAKARTCRVDPPEKIKWLQQDKLPWSKKKQRRFAD